MATSINPNNMTPEQHAKMEFVKDLLKRFREDPAQFSKHERRLGTKYEATRDSANRTTGELEQLRNQIIQGEARVRSLELQAQAEFGKAEGFLESLVELTYDESPQKPPSPDGARDKPIQEAPKETKKRGKG